VPHSTPADAINRGVWRGNTLVAQNLPSCPDMLISLASGTVVPLFIGFKLLHETKKENTMFTRNLLKHFLTFSLFALLLLPQISGPGTALAAGPASEKDPSNPVCLDVSNSAALGGKIVPVVSPNPPVQFTLFTVYLTIVQQIIL
jgi:hypothetical protein